MVAERAGTQANFQLSVVPLPAAGGRTGAWCGADAGGVPVRPGPAAGLPGAIDDSRDEDGVSRQYLRDALEAVLSAQEPAVNETPAAGCTVKWK